MKRQTLAWLWLLATVFSTVQAQNHRIFDGGVVDAASSRALVAPGSIASIYGVDLAPRTEIGLSSPLPPDLSGVRVTVDGLESPLYFISEGQINFQVPYEISLASGFVEVIVLRNGVASRAVNVNTAEYAPSVFLIADALDPAVKYTAVTHPDGELVSAQRPATPNSILVVYGNGLGVVTNRPGTGFRAVAQPLAEARVTPAITLGGVALEVQFAGQTPGSIGLSQFNVKLPANLPAGPRLPLVIQMGATTSLPVQVPVR